MEISFSMFTVNHCDSMQVGLSQAFQKYIVYSLYLGLSFEDIMASSVLLFKLTFKVREAQVFFEEGFGLKVYFADACRRKMQTRCALLTKCSSYTEHSNCSTYLYYLCIASWNATLIMSSALYISSLLDKRQTRILGQSEHWLFKHNLHFIDSINSNYVGFGIADNDLLVNSNIKVGRDIY